MVVSSHCWLKVLLEFQLLGVDDGAAGYAIDEVGATVDVVKACRGSSLLCWRSIYSASLIPKSSVIELKVLLHDTLTTERMMA